MSHDYRVALHRGVMGLSAVCDCGMFLSYSLIIVNMYLAHVHVNAKEKKNNKSAACSLSTQIKTIKGQTSLVFPVYT